MLTASDGALVVGGMSTTVYHSHSGNRSNSSTNKIMFRDGALSVSSSADGHDIDDNWW